MSEPGEVFDRLAVIVGAPGSKRFARVLEAMMTEEEAGYLVELRVPMTVEQLAEKLNIDPEELKVKLDNMLARMIIRKAKDGFVTPNNVVAFHHGAIGWLPEERKAKAYPLWGDFFFAEWEDMIADGFERRQKTGAPGAHRVVPAYRALEASPNIRPEQILWYEDMRQIFKRAEVITVAMCGCRGLWRKCQNPVDVCFKVDFPTGVKMPPPQPSDYMKPPIFLTYEEAMKIIDECEELGLVHLPLNTSQGDIYCNCCNDCCMVINPLLKRGKVHEILTPSRYRAAVDEDKCVGCKKCLSRCKFDAIEMAPVPGTDKFKARVNAEHCMGCGACVITCKTQAMTLELARPPSHIPTCSAMELFQMEMKKTPPPT
ncbi:MAG: 4Fe-4S binding protein [Dehalococcoidales bacterium]|nr:4Fe-4S binding protein [Dehalococcoidales bacterium]